MRPLIGAIHVWRGCRLSVHMTTLAADSMLPITWRLMFGATCIDEVREPVEFSNDWPPSFEKTLMSKGRVTV